MKTILEKGEVELKDKDQKLFRTLLLHNSDRKEDVTLKDS